jgi:N6-adenosine-specific RNA methylase IME4
MTTRAEYAAQIADAWAGAREAVFETGRVLVAAKAELPHGQFLAMIAGDLPFVARTAQRLMAVAKDARLTNATRVSLLPTAGSTLYELTRLDDAAFEAALQSGAIRPDMERKDAQRLVAGDRRTHRLRVAEAAARGAVPLGDAVRGGRRYAVILADPAWHHDVISDKGYDKAAANHYPTMSLDAIKALPVAALAHDDAALFVWATVPHLAQAMAVIEAWGFAYKSHFVWDKEAAGTGYWNRNRHELLLLATKGGGLAPGMEAKPDSVHREMKGAHSAKPQWFRAMIEQMFPGLTKLEMNARVDAERCAQIGGTGRPGFWHGDDGWDYWGNEVNAGGSGYEHPETPSEAVSLASEAAAPAATEDGRAPSSSTTPALPELALAPGETVDPATGEILAAESLVCVNPQTEPNACVAADNPLGIPAFLRREGADPHARPADVPAFARRGDVSLFEKITGVRKTEA